MFSMKTTKSGELKWYSTMLLIGCFVVVLLGVFVAMAAELALVPKAQTSTFLLLAVLALVDLLIGVSVGSRTHRGIRLEDADRPPD